MESISVKSILSLTPPYEPNIWPDGYVFNNRYYKKGTDIIDVLTMTIVKTVS